MTILARSHFVRVSISKFVNRITLAAHNFYPSEDIGKILAKVFLFQFNPSVFKEF